VGEGGAETLTWGALDTMWEILAPGRCQRRRARFRRSDNEGSTTSWAGGQNRGEGRNREENGGFYQGNGTLTLTKSNSVRITDKPDKMGSSSGSGTGIMSLNVFSQIQTLEFELKQI
jgi:hypothetical protein